MKPKKHLRPSRSATSSRRSTNSPITALVACAVLLFATHDAPAFGQETTRQEDGSSADDAAATREQVNEQGRLEEAIEVRERADNLVGLAATSSEGTTGAFALSGRPIQRNGELLETVPGLIATQHSGDGKANQYFVRGFNLDHGTDFSVHVAGMPVNQPAHGHGQGYTDLNFLIPELVQRVDFRKGTAFLDGGDFSAAGSARIELVGSLDQTFGELTLGEWDFRRAVFGHSFDLGSGTLTAAVEGHTNDGPWLRGNDFERINGFLRYRTGGTESQWTITALGYDASWLSTDQVPRRAIESGAIDRFGLIDPGTGGESSRSSLSVDWDRSTDRTTHSATAYTIQSDLDLVSNFTYFLSEPEDGDQFRQLDDRRTSGLTWKSTRFQELLGRSGRLLFGADLRVDSVDNGLISSTGSIRNERVVRTDDIDQVGAGIFAGVEIGISEKVRVTAGLRADLLDVDVRSGRNINSGTEDDLLVSPKLAFVFGPWAQTEIYASYGRGFHSNDARGAVIRVDPVSGEPAVPVPLLVPGNGYEIGVRTAAVPGLQSTLTLYRLDLDSELVFVGDGGGTEPNDGSRRVGVEWTNAWRVRPGLLLEFDVAWVDAEIPDAPAGQRKIPGALEGVVSAGFDWTKEAWRLTFRLRGFDGYPLTEDGSVTSRAFLGTNLRIARQFGPATVYLEGFNLLDRDDNDIEYFYASRLAGEPADGFEDVHLHPAEPLNVRAGLSWRF